MANRMPFGNTLGYEATRGVATGVNIWDKSRWGWRNFAGINSRR